MFRRIQHILTMFALALSLVATSAWATSMDEAKAKGLIGERTNGYLGIVVSNPPSDIRRLVNDINEKRKAAYKKSAASAGAEQGVFELRMGQRLQQRTPRGQYIQLQNGNWKKK
ncbi:YdbL family protein [Pontibacterium granulatum]|uniref:YdbL family protein n=1 Tax=Pontibacterium granulatum TaxID=2036029 RepID=UPI00249B3E33|nr:YdbL family protein [Pontibacterium granulatum]MDI3324128.1 YdbL family protein [Pontibacterium granulatum]